MINPYTRQDAKRRAQMARNRADNYESEVNERISYFQRYEGDDKVAAERCIQVAQHEARFAISQASAYERIARGEPPYSEER